MFPRLMRHRYHQTHHQTHQTNQIQQIHQTDTLTLPVNSRTHYGTKIWRAGCGLSHWFWILVLQKERHWHRQRWQRNQEYISDVPSVLSSSAQGQGHWLGYTTGLSLLMAEKFAQILFCGVFCTAVENCFSSWPFECVCIIGKGCPCWFKELPQAS